MLLFSSSGESVEHCMSEKPDDLELDWVNIWHTSMSDDWVSNSGDDDPLEIDGEEDPFDEILFCTFSP